MRTIAFACVMAVTSCAGGAGETHAVVEPLPSAPSATAIAKAPPAPACDDDTTEPFDCSTLQLGDCSAGKYYACPKSSGLPAGMGFRAKVAANIGKCLARPGFDGSISVCVKPLEACVREAVGGACADDEALATCKTELATCSSELQNLCAKLLSSLEPKTRVSALSDMREQRQMKGSATTCEFSWDLNGFPFCPYCPFRP